MLVNVVINLKHELNSAQEKGTLYRHIPFSVVYNCNRSAAMFHEVCGSKLALCRCCDCEGICFTVDLPLANLDLKPMKGKKRAFSSKPKVFLISHGLHHM